MIGRGSLSFSVSPTTLDGREFRGPLLPLNLRLDSSLGRDHELGTHVLRTISQDVGLISSLTRRNTGIPKVARIGTTQPTTKESVQEKPEGSSSYFFVGLSYDFLTPFYALYRT